MVSSHDSCDLNLQIPCHEDDNRDALTISPMSEIEDRDPAMLLIPIQHFCKILIIELAIASNSNAMRLWPNAGPASRLQVQILCSFRVRHCNAT